MTRTIILIKAMMIMIIAIMMKEMITLTTMIFINDSDMNNLS